MTSMIEIKHMATGYARLAPVVSRTEAEAVAHRLEYALHRPDDWYAKIALIEKLVSEASKNRRLNRLSVPPESLVSPG